MMRPLRVAFLTNIVSPYRKPVFERLAQTPNWWFRVFACAANEHDRTWEVDLSGLEVVIPKTLSWRRRVKTEGPVRFEQDLTLHVPVGLWGALRQGEMVPPLAYGWGGTPLPRPERMYFGFGAPLNPSDFVDVWSLRESARVAVEGLLAALRGVQADDRERRLSGWVRGAVGRRQLR